MAEDAQSWARAWHGVVEAITTILDLPTPLQPDDTPALVRAKFDAIAEALAAAEARADRAGEDVLDRLVSASQEEPSPPYRVAIREFLRQQRAALRARAIIKETPHDA